MYKEKGTRDSSVDYMYWEEKLKVSFTVASNVCISLARRSFSPASNVVPTSQRSGMGLISDTALSHFYSYMAWSSLICFLMSGFLCSQSHKQVVCVLFTDEGVAKTFLDHEASHNKAAKTGNIWCFLACIHVLIPRSC